MATKKTVTLNLKFEKVDEVFKEVEGLQEEVEVYIQLASDNIKELLGTDNFDEKLDKFINKISNLDWDSITDNPRIQKPPITLPTFEKLS